MCHRSVYNLFVSNKSNKEYILNVSNNNKSSLSFSKVVINLGPEPTFLWFLYHMGSTTNSHKVSQPGFYFNS